MKGGNKIIGCFSYAAPGDVYCDGDACVIAGSKALMLTYMKARSTHNEAQDILKKTTLGEIIKGLKLGGAYAFDEDAYRRFYPLAKKNGMDDLPVGNEFFSEPSPTGLHFMRIQLVR